MFSAHGPTTLREKTASPKGKVRRILLEIRKKKKYERLAPGFPRRVSNEIAKKKPFVRGNLHSKVTMWAQHESNYHHPIGL